MTMPNQDDKFLLLLEKISEISERTVRMETEQKNMKEDLEEVKRQDIKQNELLAEHIAGVDTQAKRLDNEIEIRKSIQEETMSIKSRVERLEEAPKFRATMKQYIIFAATLLSALVAVAKLLKLINL
jgi:xylose isomerase